jgi:ABC-type multidrug transport system fused ATPase/permease subunit
MHQDMAKKVIRADIVFFDSNPSGRVTTRFSKDMTILDIMVPPVLLLVTQGMLRAISVAISVIIINPWILLVVFVGLIYIIWVVKTAMPTMVDA